jgi:hypothetical protein
MNSTSASFKLKCYGGVLHGRTYERDREQFEFKLDGYWYEQSARRDGDYWVFVPRPKNKGMRKALMLFMSVVGRDPRLDDRREPAISSKRGRNKPCYCGSGKKYKKCHGGVA